MSKDILYTALKPTGKLTLGNYIGVGRMLKDYSENYQSYICVADLHALTINMPAEELRENIYDMFALFLALGLDVDKSVVYVQSHVPAHTQLGWVLNNYTMFGEASRMTQFKDHVAKGTPVNVGLFDYPVLMAADILLYDTKYVPVGIDQLQHVEITRDIAMRFNNKCGETFVIPEPILPKTGAKIMGLQQPTKKMSKSEAGDTGTIMLEDSEDVIRKKIKRAVTDSDGVIKYDVENKPGVSNLLTIYATMKNITIEETVKHFEGCNYGALKNETADAVVEVLSKFQERYFKLRQDRKYLEEVMRKGALKANEAASKKIKQVYKTVGLV